MSSNRLVNFNSGNFNQNIHEEYQEESKIIQFSRNFCNNIQSDSIVDKIACFSCKNISTLPRMCKFCNTVFCYYCCKKFESDKSNSCAKCKKTLTLLELNNDLNQILKNLKIRCLNNIPNEEKTCKEILLFGNLIEHFNKCNYSKGFAKCMGCNKEGTYEEIITHTYKCNEVIIKCGICSEKIRKKYIESHEKKCQEMIINCPICSLNCKTAAFEEHKTKDFCLLKKIEDIKDEFEKKMKELYIQIQYRDEKINVFEERLRKLENVKSESINENFNHVKEEDYDFKKKIIDGHKKLNNDINNLRENIFQIKSNINEMQDSKLDSKANNNKKENIQKTPEKAERIIPKKIINNLANHMNKLNLENPEILKFNNLKCVKTIDAHSSVIYKIKELKTKIQKKNALISAGGDNLLKIWDSDDFTNLSVLQGHSDQILTFCEIKNLHNKQYLLSTGEDKLIILWDLKELKLLKKFRNAIHDSRIWRMLNFKNNLKYNEFDDFIISCGDDNSIKIFNYENEKVISKIANGNDKVKCLLQYNTNKEKFKNLNNSGFKMMHFLVSGDSGKKIKIWKLNYLENNSNEMKIEIVLLNTLEFHSNYISELKKIKWEKNLFTIASASADETIKIIDLETLSCIFTLKGHVDKIYTIEPVYFSDSDLINGELTNLNRTYLFSGGKDKTIKIWDLQSGILLKNLLNSEESVRSLHVWNKNLSTLLSTKLSNKNDKIFNFAFLSAGSDSSIKIWS